MLCENNLQCLFDLAVTQETTFAMETLEQEKIANTTTKTLRKPLAAASKHDYTP